MIHIVLHMHILISGMEQPTEIDQALQARVQFQTTIYLMYNFVNACS